MRRPRRLTNTTEISRDASSRRSNRPDVKQRSDRWNEDRGEGRERTGNEETEEASTKRIKWHRAEQSTKFVFTSPSVEIDVESRRDCHAARSPNERCTGCTIPPRALAAVRSTTVHAPSGCGELPSLHALP